MSFSYESSYDNCNLLTGEKLIKSKLLKDKLKNYLINEMNVSSAVHNSNIKKIISTDLYNNESTYSRFLTPINKKNSSLSPEKRIPKRKKTNIGLNIVNIWEGIKKEMSTVNN